MCFCTIPGAGDVSKQMRSGLHGDDIPVGEDLAVEAALSKDDPAF